MATNYYEAQRDYERRLKADLMALDPGATLERSQNILIPEFWLIRLSNGMHAAGTSFEEAASFAIRHLREIRHLTDKLIR